MTDEISPLEGHSITFILEHEGNSQQLTKQIQEHKLYSFGRERCWMTITDSGISKTHFTLLYINEKLTLKDEGSTNGTFVNEEKIDQVEIVPGDIVEFGAARLTFVKIGAKGIEVTETEISLPVEDDSSSKSSPNKKTHPLIKKFQVLWKDPKGKRKVILYSLIAVLAISVLLEDTDSLPKIADLKLPTVAKENECYPVFEKLRNSLKVLIKEKGQDKEVIYKALLKKILETRKKIKDSNAVSKEYFKQTTEGGDWQRPHLEYACLSIWFAPYIKRLEERKK